MKYVRIACAALVAAFTAGGAWAQGQAYNPANFDVYKYSQDGTPVPDVDKLAHGHVGLPTCWQACASNILAAAGYGVGAGVVATAQQRADYIYTQLTNDLGTANMGFGEQAINYWLYTYGKNPDNLTGDYLPNNRYTDVTAVHRPLVLAGGAAASDYDFLLNELKRCQYVGVSFSYPDHGMALVGGNYWGNPNGKPDGNKSIWHDSDRDQPDTVVSIDDDVYVNAPDGSNFWTLADYVTTFANGYVTLCPGLNKPEYAARNYDLAWLRTDTDKNGTWDTIFFASGLQKQNYAAPVWLNDNTVRIGNEESLFLRKDIYLLVDYVDRVPGRIQNLILSAIDPKTGALVVLAPTTVTPSTDNGQLLFYWDLDFQPAWEDITFPDAGYRFLYDPTVVGGLSDVKDWNIATYCDIPEPATMTLLALSLGALALRRRKR